MSPPNRRRFVALVGAALSGVAFAGCSNESDADSGPDPSTDATTATTASSATATATAAPTATVSSTQSPTPGSGRRLPVGETFESDDIAVTVENSRVRKMVPQNTPVARVVRVHGGQYLLVDVTIERPPETLALGVGYDGDVPASTDWFVTGRSDTAFPGRDWETYDGVTVALPVPVRDGDAAVVLALDDPVVWHLPAAVESALAVAPEFRIDSVTVDASADGAEVTFTVRNTGDRDGVFLAKVSHDAIHDASSLVEFAVPAGETVTHTASPGALSGHSYRRATYVSVRSVRNIQRDISVPTPTPGPTQSD